jgi:hypothetical protein
MSESSKLEGLAANNIPTTSTTASKIIKTNAVANGHVSGAVNRLIETFKKRGETAALCHITPFDSL